MSEFSVRPSDSAGRSGTAPKEDPGGCPGETESEETDSARGNVLLGGVGRVFLRPAQGKKRFNEGRRQIGALCAAKLSAPRRRRDSPQKEV